MSWLIVLEASVCLIRDDTVSKLTSRGGKKFVLRVSDNICLLHFRLLFIREANTMNPDQTAPKGAV